MKKTLLTLFLFLTFIAGCAKTYRFEDLVQEIDFNTFNYRLSDSWKSLQLENDMLTVEIKDSFMIDSSRIERIEDYCDLSGEKEGEVFYIKVYSNGYIETSENNYYFDENLSLYDKLLSEFVK